MFDGASSIGDALQECVGDNFDVSAHIRHDVSGKDICVSLVTCVHRNSNMDETAAVLKAIKNMPVVEADRNMMKKKVETLESKLEATQKELDKYKSYVEIAREINGARPNT